MYNNINYRLKLKPLIRHLDTYVFRVQQRSDQGKEALDLTFSDYKTAYKSQTTWEVFRGLVVYQLCSVKPLVRHNMTVMNAMKKVLGNTIFSWLMKMSFYGHFVVGQDEVSIKPKIERLATFGVHPILDYSVEEDESGHENRQSEIDRRYKLVSARTYFYRNEATCEKNCETFLKCLESVAPYGAGYAAIKLTALGRPSLLYLISDVINKTRGFMEELVGKEGSVISQHVTKEQLVARLQAKGVTDKAAIDSMLSRITEDKDGIINLFPWSGIIDTDSKITSSFVVPDLKTGSMVTLLSQLKPEEEAKFRNLVRRIKILAMAAKELGVSMMVDAEQSYFQPAISRLTVEFMSKFNTERPIVLNTYQCYMKNALSELTADLEQSERQNFYFGAKLVRGAYLEQERARASLKGYPDPTNPNYEATGEMYHSSLQHCIHRVEKLKSGGKDPRRVTIVVASHNEETVRFALQEMRRSQVGPTDGVVSFAQLYGMCDAISFPLGQSGYSVYKYMPYGPVNKVLPYLSRRVQENSGVLTKVKKEKSLLRKEMLRRIVTLHFFRKPKGPFQLN